MNNQSKESKIAQKQTETLIDENIAANQMHPASDIGHSYAYNQMNDEKIEANLKYDKLVIEKLINKYQDILKTDDDLNQKFKNIDDFFKFKNDEIVNRNSLREKFLEVILSVEQLTQEEQRITEESMSDAKNTNDNALNFNELKRELIQIKEDMLKMY